MSAPAAQFDVRQMQAGDCDAVRELFAEVFGHTLSEDLWRWKYAHTGGHGTVVFRDGVLVGHYGGIGRDILFLGQPGKAVQITDVMVKARERRAVRHNSPFFLAGRLFLEQFIGYDNPYLLGFGFPSDRHMRLAQLLKLYAPVGRMMETVWELRDGAGGIPLWWQALPLGSHNWERYTDLLDRLWLTMAQDMGGTIVGVRDSGYIRHRYLDHPETDYQVLLIRNRLTRSPLGLIVLKHTRKSTMLMDLVAAADRIPFLLEAALEAARRLGGGTLSCWCAAAHAERFARAGGRQSLLPITTPANIWTRSPEPEALLDKWWLTAGDTDFL